MHEDKFFPLFGHFSTSCPLSGVNPSLPSLQNMKSLRSFLFVFSIATCAVSFTCASARAVLVEVPEALLTAPAVNPASIVSFDELATGTAINGKTIKGFTFSENLANATASPSTMGPGNTNHITGQVALSSGSFPLPSNYALTIGMPGAVTSFGFGYALNSFTPVTNGITVTLFNGATNLGSLPFTGGLDPTFAGGFMGIGSSDPFTSAVVTFASTVPNFAIDNVAAASPVPEPGTAALFGLGLMGAAMARRRR
jgi:PEP-CTERM motif